MTNLAFGGSNPDKAAISAEARNLARSSRALPIRTTPRSMAGSSKNVLQPRAGKAAATAEMVNAAVAPRPTREFMSGAPRARAENPSTTISRPGPKRARAERVALTGVLPRKWTHEGAEAPNQCKAWCTRHAEANIHANVSLFVASRSLESLSARFDATTLAEAPLPASAGRTVAA